MNAAKFSVFVKNLFIAGSLLALASLPANADLVIGISFPSQGGEDNDVPEIDESLLTLPKLHLQETPCFENLIWSGDPTVKYGTTYTLLRTYYPHQGPTFTTATFVFPTNSFPLAPAKFNQVVSSYFTGLTVPEQLQHLSRIVNANGTPTSAASNSSTSDSISATAPQPATAVLNLSLDQNTLKLDWPADHIGWILQTQTNPGINSQWFPILGSSLTNHLDLTLDRANTSVFFRLIAP